MKPAHGESPVEEVTDSLSLSGPEHFPRVEAMVARAMQDVDQYNATYSRVISNMKSRTDQLITLARKTVEAEELRMKVEMEKLASRLEDARSSHGTASEPIPLTRTALPVPPKPDEQRRE